MKLVVVTVPTEKSSHLVLFENNVNPKKWKYYNQQRSIKHSDGFVQHHIHFISLTEPIKENTNTYLEGFNGDWYYNSIYKSIACIGNITSHDFKIIASTDPNLKLPLIPTQFIKEYVENKGNIQTVELDEAMDSMKRVVLTNKQNEVIILPNAKPEAVHEQPNAAVFTKDDMIKAYNYGQEDCGEFDSVIGFDPWFNENYC